MATKREKNEVRHRWTDKERGQLLAKSEGYKTIGEAADGIYVEMGQPRQAVYAQLYDLFLRGRAPHLGLSREAKTELSPSFARALREFIRVMRVEGISDALVSVHEAGVSVQVSRRASETFEVEL